MNGEVSGSNSLVGGSTMLFTSLSRTLCYSEGISITSKTSSIKMIYELLQNAGSSHCGRQCLRSGQGGKRELEEHIDIRLQWRGFQTGNDGGEVSPRSTKLEEERV